MIHVFHGFLGSPADFSFLKSRQPIKLHDLYEENVEDITVSPDDTLIGYSMGGRVAMEIAVRHAFNIKKLVIINAHPGLPKDVRAERSVWEEAVLERLNTLSSDDFLKYWNALPLFSADRPLHGISLERYNKSANIFNQYRLSRQTCFLPELIAHKDKILWIAGLQDEKYADLARDMIASNGISCEFITGGHRLYQEGQRLTQILIEKAII